MKKISKRKQIEDLQSRILNRRTEIDLLKIKIENLEEKSAKDKVLVESMQYDYEHGIGHLGSQELVVEDVQTWRESVRTRLDALEDALAPTSCEVIDQKAVFEDNDRDQLPDWYDYTPIPNFLEKKESPIHGEGIFATEDINRDTLICDTHVRVTGPIPKTLRTPVGGYLNHSKSPNCKFIIVLRRSQFVVYSVKALKPIQPGEELTVNYETAKHICG